MQILTKSTISWPKEDRIGLDFQRHRSDICQVLPIRSAQIREDFIMVHEGSNCEFVALIRTWNRVFVGQNEADASTMIVCTKTELSFKKTDTALVNGKIFSDKVICVSLALVCAKIVVSGIMIDQLHGFVVLKVVDPENGVVYALMGIQNRRDNSGGKKIAGAQVHSRNKETECRKSWDKEGRLH